LASQDRDFPGVFPVCFATDQIPGTAGQGETSGSRKQLILQLAVLRVTQNVPWQAKIGISPCFQFASPQIKSQARQGETFGSQKQFAN
jgi:hypothetical protein